MWNKNNGSNWKASTKKSYKERNDKEKSSIVASRITQPNVGGKKARVQFEPKKQSQSPIKSLIFS